MCYETLQRNEEEVLVITPRHWDEEVSELITRSWLMA